MIKAVILAGGKGTRLRPITNNIPKAMVKILDKPFLEYQINLLRSYKITSFVICCCYLKEVIMDYFRDGSEFDVNIEYSIEKDFLGTGGALKNAKKLITDKFLFLNGDSYLDIDYHGLVEFSLNNDYLGTIVSYDNQINILKNNIQLNEKNMITGYSKVSEHGMDHIDAGVAIFNKKVLDLIPGDRQVSLEEEIYPSLIQKRQLAGYVVSKRFYDIGTLEGIKDIEEVLA
ncbi:MAG: sugar phosphate nucleotidyltransferase [Candidatus Omnitrophota bacterium]